MDFASRRKDVLTATRCKSDLQSAINANDREPKPSPRLCSTNVQGPKQLWYVVA